MAPRASREIQVSVPGIPLRKTLQLFYATPALRRQILKIDIRLDRRKEIGHSRSQGGDFFQPFWTDVKKHMSGQGETSALTKQRVAKNPTYERLYLLLEEGIVELINENLRWSNETMEVSPESAHGAVRFDDLRAAVRVRDALYAKVRGEYTRVVYPYFSEEPALPEEGGRLGLWVLQNALSGFDKNDMRVIDPLRKRFFSPKASPLRGDEGEVFRGRYKSLIDDWEQLVRE
jgi:hypothetical protein